MTAAHLYFALMIALMTPLIFVHLMCWQIVKRFPGIMPDTMQRERYMWAEVAMACGCVSMLWYMWLVLPFMVSFCATEPLAGAAAHMPWIAFTACVLLAKTRHLWRFLAQVKAL